MLPQPLAVRFLLDAQDAFLAAVDHIPAPGRGGPLGRLNAPGWIVAHLASSHDMWINVLVGGRERDPWMAAWLEAQLAATLANPLPTPLAEAREAVLAIFARAAEVVATLDADALAREVSTPRGVVTAGYLVARAPGHLFAHAGELAVVGALVTAPELDLPGNLARVAGAVSEAAESQSNAELPPLLVRLLLDAQGEFARVVDALSVPAAVGAIPRVRSGIETIASVVAHEDAAWCGAERSPTKVSSFVTFDEARAAYARTTESAQPYLEGLRAADLARPVGTSTLGAAVARSVGLLFAKAGELNALASLFGAADLGLPGALAQVAER